MNYPDSPTVPYGLEDESSDDDARSSASSFADHDVFNAGWLNTLLDPAYLGPSAHEADQPVSNPSSSSSSYVTAPETHELLNEPLAATDPEEPNREHTGESELSNESQGHTTRAEPASSQALPFPETQGASPPRAESHTPPSPELPRLNFRSELTFERSNNMNVSGSISHGHHDIIQVIQYNYDGQRVLTGSSDHHVKVWDKRGEDWQLTDTFRAHDAEIMDVSTQQFSDQPF